MSHVRNPFDGRWHLVLLVFAGLAFGSVPSASAADPADPDSFRSLDVGRGVVTMDVQDRPFGQVVTEVIQPQTRVNIVVSPDAAEQTVSMRVVDLHWVQALDALTERIGGVLVRKAQNLLRVERPTPVEMEFEDEDVRTVIRTIAESANANVIVTNKIEGQITVSLNGTPWLESLRHIVRVAGYALVEHDYGILTVVPRDELELDTDYYRFKYLRPPAPYKGVVASQSGGSGNGGGGGGGGSGNDNGGDIVVGQPYVPTDDPSELERQFPIIDALRAIVAPDNGTVRYIPTQNSIIFTGTAPSLQRVKSMVQQLDIEPPQVFIDMNFVVTSNSDAINLGLDAGNTSGLGVGFSGADVLHMLPFNVGQNGQGVSNLLNGTTFPSPGAAAFNYGTLNTSQTQLLWNFLQRDTSTRIVQAPKLLALDNQEATIFIGESIRYARTTAATNQNGGLQFAVEEDPNSPVNVGFQLLVIPHVIPGESKIRMTVIPQRRALTGTGPLPGFDRISVAGQAIDLPRVQSTTLVTHMILRDGQTAVIGGLLEDREVKTKDKIPFLGDLPFLAGLFQGTQRTKVKEHLLITITPRIMKGTDAASCAISNELAFRTQQISSEFSQMYGASPCSPSTVGGEVVYPAPAPSTTVAPPPPVVSDPVPIAPGR